MGESLRFFLSTSHEQGQEESAATLLRHAVKAVLGRETTDNAETVLCGPSGLFVLEPVVAVKKAETVCAVYAGVSFSRESGVAEQRQELRDVTELVRPLLSSRVVLRTSGIACAWAGEETGAGRLEYRGLQRALDIGPDEVLAWVEREGLTEPGNRGSLLSESWRILRGIAECPRYVVLRGFDKDPWGRTAWLLWENDPSLLFEGLLIAAYAIGAARVFVCISENNPKYLETGTEVAARLQELGLVDAKRSSSGFSCELTMGKVPDLLVLGENTALTRVLEGRQALPYVVAESTSVGVPLLDGVCLVMEAETAAQVACLFRDGALPSQARVVTVWDENVPVCTLEVPLTTPVGQITNMAARLACPEGDPTDWLGKVTAVQLGGPTGPFLALADTNLPLLDALPHQAEELGVPASVRVFRQGCAVERALELLSYVQSQSCGQCVFCREGTYQLGRILGALVHGDAGRKDLDVLAELAEAMLGANVCWVGNTATIPLLSSLQLFPDDFSAHLETKACPHGRV